MQARIARLSPRSAGPGLNWLRVFAHKLGGERRLTAQTERND